MGEGGRGEGVFGLKASRSSRQCALDVARAKSLGSAPALESASLLATMAREVEAVHVYSLTLISRNFNLEVNSIAVQAFNQSKPKTKTKKPNWF